LKSIKLAASPRSGVGRQFSDVPYPRQRKGRSDKEKGDKEKTKKRDIGKEKGHRRIRLTAIAFEL
jgi:hypothetical protein